MPTSLNWAWHSEIMLHRNITLDGIVARRQGCFGDILKVVNGSSTSGRTDYLDSRKPIVKNRHTFNRLGGKLR